MLFSDAIVALSTGEYVTREAWTNGQYLAFMPGMVYVWQVQPNSTPDPRAGAYPFTLADYLADDWKVL